MRRFGHLKAAVAGVILALLPALAAASEQAAHGAGGEHGNEQIMTLIFSTVNFVIFVGLLFFLLKKPVANFLKNRKETQAREMDEAARMLEDARRRHEEMKERLDRLDREMAEIKERLKSEGEEQGKRIIEQSRLLVEKIREDAKFQAEQQVKMARRKLQEEAARLAVETAEEILKKSVEEKDHDRLVGRFLEEVKKP